MAQEKIQLFGMAPPTQELIYADPNNRIVFTRYGDVCSIRLSGALREEIEACADIVKSYADTATTVYLPVLVGLAETSNRVYGYLAINPITCVVYKVATYGGGASAMSDTDRAFGTCTWIRR